MTNQISESGEVSYNVKPKDAWDEQMLAVKDNGIRLAKEIQEQGHIFDVEILAPREISGRTSIPLAAVKLELDWKIATRLEMVEHARDLLTKAYMLESLDPALPTVLAAIIEGRGLYEHGIGEFFLLYGQFEQKHRTSRKTTRAEMMALVKGDPKYMKRYKERGKETLEPLPYAVRNILSHVGMNPNTLDPDGDELTKSIELLRIWVSKK